MIDVEEPVSFGSGSPEAQWWGPRPFPNSTDPAPYPSPVLLRLTPRSGQLFRIAYQERAVAFPAGRGLREGARWVKPSRIRGIQSVPFLPPPRRRYPWVSPWPLRLLQAALSVLGYVEADKENGESVWVAPSVPAVPGPGDAFSPLRPPGQRGARPRTHMVPPVPNLVPIVVGPRNYPDPSFWGLPGGGGNGHSWTQLDTDTPSPVGSNLSLGRSLELERREGRVGGRHTGGGGVWGRSQDFGR